MIQYFDNGKHAIFQGVLFCRDEKTGYYLNSGTSTRLHRAVWESVNGKIPDGYHIHHIDHDKNNNEIENLQLVTSEMHRRIHADELTEEQRENKRQNLNNNARPKASEWHGSKEGITWHKIHYAETKEKLHEKRIFKCAFCGKEYTSEVTGQNRFCSNKCRSAARRQSGVDNEIRKCVCCGKNFITNRYSKGKTCSRLCASRLRWDKVNPQDRKEAAGL